MTLLSAWWLLLLPVLYFVVILHTLHPQRHSVLVPSTFLWQRVLKELAADARWRRIVANLLLLAQLAALTCIILALTRPAFLLPASRQRQDIVLIDTSASMAATDVAPNRLQAAVERLLAEIRKDRPRRITVINAGPRPAIIYDGNASMAALSIALRRVEPAHGSTDWERAAILAASSLASSRGQVIIASDGALEAKDLAMLVELMGKTPIRLVQVAGRADNIGIVAFDARQAGDSLAQYEVLITVANYTGKQVQTNLVLHDRKKEIGRRVVTLPAGEKRDIVFQHTFATQDVLTASLDYNDSLALDNQAHLAAYPPTPTRVLLIGPGNYYLEQGLRIFPQVRLEKRLLYPEDATDYPLVIFDAIPVPPSFKGTALYLAGSPADRALGVRKSPEVTWWDRSHPLTRFVNWSDLGLRQSYLLSRQEGAQVLVESENGPLLQLTQDTQKRILTLAFALEDSDWPVKVAFPVFLSHLLQWAHPEGWEFIRKPLAPGASLVLPRSMRTEQGWQVRRPDGTTVRVSAQEGAEFSNTLKSGLYTVVSSQGEFPFAVNAGSLAESNIRPRLTLPSATTNSTDSKMRLPFTFWWPFAFMAFLLLLAEGWLYTHKVRRPVQVDPAYWCDLARRLRHVQLAIVGVRKSNTRG